MTIKNLLLVLMAVLLPLSSLNVYADPVGIPLQVEYDDPSDDQDNPQRTPVLIPEVSIDGYELLFGTPCDGCILRIVNASGEVEYTTVIPTNATSLVLPSTLSGDYELQIVQGYWCFYGDITL